MASSTERDLVDLASEFGIRDVSERAAFARRAGKIVDNAVEEVKLKTLTEIRKEIDLLCARARLGGSFPEQFKNLASEAFLRGGEVAKSDRGL